MRGISALLLSALAASSAGAYSIPHSTFTLSNGIRVVFAPDRSVPTAAVSLVVPAGARQESKGRSGFAHLFEHLMFDGSAHVKKGDFDRILEGYGGESNAWTQNDMTFYYETVPANAVPVALWLDADRLSSLRVREKNLRNQVEVVKEEKRQNVFNEPYMRLLWVEIQAKIYSNWTLSHDTYGSFKDLDAASLDDVKKFFTDWYAPSNTTLAVVGDFDPAATRAVLERYFGWIPDRGERTPVDRSEPPQEKARSHSILDEHARLPALASVWSGMPERGSRGYYAMTLLGRYLYSGKSARLYQRLVKEEKVATAVDDPAPGGLGFPIVEWQEYRAPGLFGGIVMLKEGVAAERVAAIVDEEIAKVARDGIPGKALERLKTKFKSDWVVGAQTALDRAWILLRHAALDGDPGRANGELERFLSVEADETREAARRYLKDSSKNSFVVTPGRAK
jgi:predicted Zn-dependent peptidase